MKWLPALSAPTVCFTRSKKYCLKIFGSSVLPDLLDTTNNVFARSTFCSNALTWGGSVESRTYDLGKPEIGPKVNASTSGHKLDPPMPSTSTSRNPSFLISSATPRSFCSCPISSSVMLSQPNQLASSVPVHSDASRCHKRRTLPPARQSS